MCQRRRMASLGGVIVVETMPSLELLPRAASGSNPPDIRAVSGPLRVYWGRVTGTRSAFGALPWRLAQQQVR